MVECRVEVMVVMKAEKKVDSKAPWSVATKAGDLVPLMVAMIAALRGVMKAVRMAVMMVVSKDACSAEKMVGKMADSKVD